MWNWLRVLFWKIIYYRMIDPEKEIRKCAFCGKVYLRDVDSIKYRHWNISGYYEEYFLCSTGKGSCYASFIGEYVEAPDSEDLMIYVVNG